MIDGNVDGNVRVFSRNVILQGIVGKNVSAFANSVDLVSKANVGGGMIVFAAEADLDGKMQRDLLGMIGRTDLDGICLLYTSPSTRDLSTSRMPSSA